MAASLLEIAALDLATVVSGFEMSVLEFKKISKELGKEFVSKGIPKDLKMN